MCKFERAEKVECISTCLFIDKVSNLWPSFRVLKISKVQENTSWKEILPFDVEKRKKSINSEISVTTA